jgi:hypothetical protein
VVREQTLPAEHLPRQLLTEFTELIGVPAHQRRYSEALLKVAYAFHAISPQAYRLVREIRPLPSVTTLRTVFRADKAPVIKALSGGELNEYLQNWREVAKLAQTQIVCALAFDAAAVSSTGLSNEVGSSGSCFAFLLLRLDHRIAHWLVPIPSGQD